MMNSQSSLMAAPIVVIVDDDYEDAYSLKREIHRYREDVICDTVVSGAELFEYLNCSGKFEAKTYTHAPSVILMDINMPLENGFEVLKQLRNDPAHKFLSVVMFSTSDSNDDIRNAYKAGANSYIQKPANLNDMREIAEKLCDFWVDVSRSLRTG